MKKFKPFTFLGSNTKVFQAFASGLVQSVEIKLKESEIFTCAI